MLRNTRDVRAVAALVVAILASAGCARTQVPATRMTQQGDVATAATSQTTNVVLGCPTDTSVVLSVLSASDTNASVAYGTEPDALSAINNELALVAGQPQEVTLDGLAADTRYYYRVTDATSEETVAEGAFRTQRAPGATFSFTVTADSHLDSNTDLALYERTLANAASEEPDFHIDLGDTFMTDKYQDRGDAGTQYSAQRSYFGSAFGSVPLYLVLGNHDGEAGKSLRGGAESEAVWSHTMRTLYFPNPQPDGFYSGDEATAPYVNGSLEDYYAWTWGDALFVMLNPYWNSGTGPTDDAWGLTLGKEQHDWLAETLRSSDATYKFVFVHQLVGGLGKPGRGGSEAAAFGEWGGKNADGSDGFAANRPGWGVPIHQLLVDNGVTAVFHGHDHLYAKQDLDGIVYQEVPQPGFPGLGDPSSAAEYGYTQGTILGGSGHLRVTVSPDAVTTDYIRAYLPQDENTERTNGEIAHSYTIDARQEGS